MVFAAFSGSLFFLYEYDMRTLTIYINQTICKYTRISLFVCVLSFSLLSVLAGCGRVCFDVVVVPFLWLFCIAALPFGVCVCVCLCVCKCVSLRDTDRQTDSQNPSICRINHNFCRGLCNSVMCVCVCVCVCVRARARCSSSSSLLFPPSSPSRPSVSLCVYVDAYTYTPTHPLYSCMHVCVCVCVCVNSSITSARLS